MNFNFFVKTQRKNLMGRCEHLARQSVHCEQCCMMQRGGQAWTTVAGPVALEGGGVLLTRILCWPPDLTSLCWAMVLAENMLATLDTTSAAGNKPCDRCVLVHCLAQRDMFSRLALSQMQPNAIAKPLLLMQAASLMASNSSTLYAMQVLPGAHLLLLHCPL